MNINPSSPIFSAGPFISTETPPSTPTKSTLSTPVKTDNPQINDIAIDIFTPSPKRKRAENPPYRANSNITKKPRTILQPKYNLNVSIGNGENKFGVLADIATTPTKIRAFVNDPVVSCSEEIREHILQKIQLLMVTFAVTWNTGREFFIGHTDAQGPSTPPLILRLDGKLFAFAMNAVHGSCVPVLYYLEAENEKPILGIYLKNSDYYFNQNSTVPLPAFINKADILFEGKENEGKLRDIVLHIINQLSKSAPQKDKEAGITLEKSLKTFLEKYEAVADDIIESLKEGSEEDSENKLKVIQIFKEHIHFYYEKLIGDSVFIDRILGVPYVNSSLREAVYWRRCKEMQDEYMEQSKLAKEVSPLKRKAKGNKPNLPGSEGALKLKIMESANEEQKLLLRERFNMSQTQLEEFRPEMQKALEAIDKKIKPKQLETAAECHQSYFKEKLKFKQSRQVGIFKDVLSEHCMGPEKFLELYNSKNEEEESPLTITNIKASIRGEQPLDPRIIRFLCDFFKIPQKLFD